MTKRYAINKTVFSGNQGDSEEVATYTTEAEMLAGLAEMSQTEQTNGCAVERLAEYCVRADGGAVRVFYTGFSYDEEQEY